MSASRFADRPNVQIGSEFGAHQQYVALAAHDDAMTIRAVAAYFCHQAMEERDHALMMARVLLGTDCDVTIPGTDAPTTRPSGK